MEKLNPKAIWLFFFQFIFFGLFLLIPMAFLTLPFLIILEAPFTALIGVLLNRIDLIIIFPLVSIFLLYLVLCYIWAKLTYRYWRYELTENAVKIEKGVIWKKYISIPYERVQNVDIYRGVLARLLGLSDLQIQTAGYSGGHGRYGMGRTEGKLPGIGIQVAEQLREELIKKVKGTKQGL